MNFKSLIAALCMSFVVLAAFAQEDDSNAVKFKGNIVDAESKQPVVSRIKYESLPYGSKIGVFSGDAFDFNMEGGKDYMVVVNAEGYSTYTSTVKSEENENGQIEKIIELVPNGINRIIRLEKLIFALGKADISAESHQELDQIVTMLNESETMTIQLEGHTDFRGNAKQNMKLSENRVESVKNYLVKKGIEKKRIKTKAFGGTQPLSRAGDSASRAANRRVEVRILTN